MNQKQTYEAGNWNTIFDNSYLGVQNCCATQN